VFDSLSDPMRALLSRVAVLLVGAVVGLALYALGVGGVLVVPLSVVGALVIGELYLFVRAERS
jgi:4-amino-4-deoxy-L-arabinose transferase-like glycosyltransferase